MTGGPAWIGETGHARPRRVWPPALLLLLVLPLALHLLLAATALQDGTRTNPGTWSRQGVRLDRAAQGSAARQGDLVVAVAGRPLTDWVRARAVRRHDGDQLEYLVVHRAGDRAVVAVTVRRQGWVRAARASLPSLPLVLALDLVAVAILLRRPDEEAGRPVVLLAVLVPLAVIDWPSGLAVVDLAGATGGRFRFLLQDIPCAVCWSALLHFVLYALTVAQRLASSPGPVERLAALLDVSSTMTLVGPLVVAAGIIVRYYRQNLEHRRRIRWVLAGLVGSMALFLGLAVLPQVLGGEPLLPASLQPLLFALLPLSVGAAIWKYRLFDIEVVVRRSLVYAGLTAAVLAIFVAFSWLLGQVLGPGLVLVAASGAVALLVLPVRDRLQSAVVHLVYGAREDPYEVVTRLGALNMAAAPERVLTEVAATLAASLRLPFAAVEVEREDGTLLASASYGTAERPPSEIMLWHGSRRVGRLLLDVGLRREAFGPADEVLLDGVARQLGGAGYAVLLASALQASREGLVRAREEERLRIRRDLHDGLGPTLAAASMQVEVAQALLGSDPVGAAELLTHVQAAARHAISDVRRLVDDLRPPSLDQLGLVSALQEHARDTGAGGRLTVRVECEGDLPPLSAAVEVAAYRIATEALNNVAKHARARHCVIRFASGRDLTLSVVDDGCGLPDHTSSGLGLRSMRERAAELGGRRPSRLPPGGAGPAARRSGAGSGRRGRDRR